MNEKVHLDRAHLRHLLTAMLRIRRFEEKCFELYQTEKIRGFMHLYDGEEAVSVGVIEALLAEDAIVATYREHGQALARGISMNAVMAEMYGKLEGTCRGRGGSMHIFDAATRFYGGNAIVGGGLPLAVGVALADKWLKRNTVTACFFGDGAVDEGSFHESLNLASLWKLPVLFVCENNLYAMGMAVERAEANPDIGHKGAAYRMPGEVVDGMDVVAVEAAARRLVAQVRESCVPCLLECRTYRFRAHSMFDAQLYRKREELAEWRKRDPIQRLRAWLDETSMLHAAEIERIEADIAAEIDAAMAFAESGTWEKVEDLERFAIMDRVPQ
jgi:pyruvate dehydrogenase E1 component alpha subunit